tara:strand:+ start:10132 stop:10332 length:201 start_codon:yes stop_codon:yes gene_type:complete
MEYKKVEGLHGLVKDERGVVLNTNEEEVRAARARKRAQRKKAREFEDLKQDVSDLKRLMEQIIERM